jgi:hypothetical protein
MDLPSILLMQKQTWIDCHNGNSQAPQCESDDSRSCFRDFDLGDGSTERLMLGRYSLVLAVLAATIALTARSFSEPPECMTTPGAPAPQGMHWYYRVDRTAKRHCWFLDFAGTQVRLHKNAAPSNLRSQVTAEQAVASPENDTVKQHLRS